MDSLSYLLKGLVSNPTDYVSLASLQRLLHDEEDSPLNTNNQNNDHPSTATHDAIGSVAFWVINGAWMLLFVTLLVWCCKFGGAERVTEWARGSSGDAEYGLALQRRRREREAAGRETPEQRAKRLDASFATHKVRMTVQPDDFVEDPNSEDTSSLDDDDDTCSLSVPTSSTTCTMADPAATEEGLDDDDLEAGATATADAPLVMLRTLRTVPNCCAVCLAPYEAGESVVWSSNPACQHAFHEFCLTDWLTKMMQQSGTPCPCCRQEFVVDWKEYKKEPNVSWDASRSMDVSVIRLR